MPKFDSKSFNDKVFQKYLQKVESTKENSLINSAIVNKTVNKMARALDEQVGGNYIVEPIKGGLEGNVQNYDGSTDFQYDPRDTFEQGKPIVGRMKGWTEKDFSKDITGEDFTPMAEEVKEYFDSVDMADLIAIIKGIFAMADNKNGNFASKHTLNITGTLGATSINKAITKACGDKKSKFKLVFMNSVDAEPLEELQLINFLKYTDKQGIERELTIGQYNGRLVAIDDEITAGTVYIIGEDFFEVDKLPVDKADYMEYDRTKNGGTEYYSHKERTLYSPKYISFTKKNVASLSATNAELQDGENWEVVNNGKTGSALARVNDKLIPIARIVLTPATESSSSSSSTSGS